MKNNCSDGALNEVSMYIKDFIKGNAQVITINHDESDISSTKIGTKKDILFDFYRR